MDLHRSLAAKNLYRDCTVSVCADGKTGVRPTAEGVAPYCTIEYSSAWPGLEGE